ncbi:MAG: phosphatase PAP2 family protein [Clostridia bacterium]|nr:phosphatase PAP2 family protein [Clostridia bacterium]
MNPFDLYIYNFISKLYNIPFTMFMRIITSFSSSLVIITILLCIFLLFKNKKMFLYFCFLTLTSDISSNIIKNIIKRPRPSEIIKISFNSGYSFPSTHVVISTCLYGFIIYLLRKNIKNKKLKNILSLLISSLLILIGLSRIYLGVNYSSDVIVAFILGLILLFLFIKFIYLKFGEVDFSNIQKNKKLSPEEKERKKIKKALGK